MHVWLVNTGWTGGEFGVGHRIQLFYTRAIIKAALEGGLDNVTMETEPVFGLNMPTECPGVEKKKILNPQKTWQNTKTFDEKRIFLAQLFIKNFERYAAEVSAEIKEAGPKF